MDRPRDLQKTDEKLEIDVGKTEFPENVRGRFAGSPSTMEA